MAYSAIPTRSSTDNVPLVTDVNQLQSNITAMLTGIAPYTLLASDPAGNPASGYIYLYFKTDKKLYKKDSAGTVTEIGAGGGGSAYGTVFQSQAGDKFKYPASNPAPLDTVTGTNGTLQAHLFDSATDETIEGVFQLPSDISSFTTINFEALIFHKTNKTSKTVQMVFSHSAKATTESWDDSYTDETSAAETVRDNAKELYLLDWTETISNAGWAANDQVRFKLWRDVSGDDLDEDACLSFFRVRLS